MTREISLKIYFDDRTTGEYKMEDMIELEDVMKILCRTDAFDLASFKYDGGKRAGAVRRCNIRYITTQERTE
jgi:hypothetical protein